MKGLLSFSRIPENLYTDDLAGIARDCIRRHGEDEWRAVVLTNEIHGHLGIYSTLGAKMGILARELFKRQGLDAEVSVVSFAGSVPPTSCLNDGLQVSTGASMGHGLFAVNTTEKECSARALFTCGGVTLDIRLKPGYEKIIRTDINNGIDLYGHSASYWEYIRRLALRYWQDWSRTEIFSAGKPGNS